MVGTDWLGPGASRPSMAVLHVLPSSVLRGAAWTCLLASTAFWAVAADAPPSGPDVPPSPPTLIRGTVTAIVDGDTLHLTAADCVYLVDLAGVDAPERGQTSGDLASQVLHLKVMQKQVQLVVLPPASADPKIQPVTPVPAEPAAPAQRSLPLHYPVRICGILYCDGCVNSQLVREGVAWHDASACPSATLAQDQQSARTARRGLWQADPAPVAPWQWRRQQEKAASSGTPGPAAAKIPDLSRFFQADTPPAVIEAAAALRPSPTEAPAAASSVPSAAGDRWLTASSGVRHNSTCRYYKKSNGRPCTASEGQPCRKCGG